VRGIARKVFSFQAFCRSKRFDARGQTPRPSKTQNRFSPSRQVAKKIEEPISLHSVRHAGYTAGAQVSSSLNEQRLEAKNQALNNIHQLMERWEKRITPRDLRLAERFADFELNLILHFSVEDSAEMRLACIHHKRVELRSHRAIDPIRLESGVMVDGEQEPVLVGIIKFVESPEKVVSAAIRLESVDSFYGLRPHTLYSSNHSHKSQVLSWSRSCNPVSGFGQNHVRVYARGGKFPLKIHEVLPGPLNFYADQNQSAVCV